MALYLKPPSKCAHPRDWWEITTRAQQPVAITCGLCGFRWTVTPAGEQR